MIRTTIQAAAIALYTLAFALASIVLLILIPTGDPLLWMARPWAWLILATFRVRIAASGADRIPKNRPCIYMSNHQSHFDVPALIRVLPGQYRILAKRELFFIPVFGWAIWLAGLIPVDRSRKERAVRSIERAAEKVRRGRSILIFAEGTRSSDGALQPLKKGGFHIALRSGAAIVPICICGSREVLPKGGIRINPGVIDVAILEPIETGSAGPRSIEGLMTRVRGAIEAGLRAGRAGEGT